MRNQIEALRKAGIVERSTAITPAGETVRLTIGPNEIHVMKRVER